jgi:CAAX prenyl protease-like protein
LLFRILPFAVLVGVLALEQLLRDSSWRDAIDWRWVTVARGLVVGCVLAAFWPRYVELRPLRLTMHQLRFAVASGLFVFVLWILLDNGWAVVGSGAGGFVPLDAQGHLDGTLYLLRLAGFALAVPIAEELFWRSFLLRWIDRKRFLEGDPRHASFKAIAICSVLFALEHSQWLAGLAAGIIYTMVYTRTGNLWAPIVSHAITNATLGLFILATAAWALW